jgi:translation initiation factor eIF-2B subunit gamma
LERMGPAMGFQVVVLAGGLSKKLYPLVSKDVPKALLPVGNKPVLSYVLELLEASNLKDIIVVVSGEDAALCIGNWVTEAVHDRLRVEVIFPAFISYRGSLEVYVHSISARVCGIRELYVAFAGRIH